MARKTILLSSFVALIAIIYYIVSGKSKWAVLPGFHERKTSRNALSEFYKLHHDPKKQGDSTTSNHGIAAETYFTITTDFFEWGWGDAIHMAPMKKEWTFKRSMDFWELWFAKELGINSNSKVVDMGMGIGGPMRRIAEFSGAHITGITNVKHQIKRATHETNRCSKYVQDRVQYVLDDYNNVKNLPSNSYDIVYFMESLSHSENRTFPLSEAYRLLKPGGIVGAWQWMLKDTFNYNDSYHMELKWGMEYGGGLKNLNKPNERKKEFLDAGFKDIINNYDMSDISNEMDWLPFWKSLLDGHDIASMFTSSYFGRYLTMFIAWFTEIIGLAEPGTYDIAVMLEFCADCTVKSGQLDIFTPLWFTMAQKPQ